MATPIKWGSEQTLQANTKAITTLPDGRTFSVWESAATATSSAQLFGQFYGADGLAIGGAVLIRGETSVAITQSYTTVAVLDDGQIAVGWTAEYSDYWVGNGVQVIGADGSLSGPAIALPTAIFNGFGIGLTALENGQFMAWGPGRLGTDTYGQVQQIFNADGTADSSPAWVRESEYWSNIQRLPDGRFIGTREVYDSAVPPVTAVIAQVFNSDFSLAGAAFQLNSTQGNVVTATQLVQLPDGRLVAVWNSAAPGAENATFVHGQVFYADGARSGGEFAVNTNPVHVQSTPDIVVLADGRFVVSWTESTSGTSVTTMQVFNPDGSPSGAAFDLASPSGLHQFFPSLEALADGRFLVKWYGAFDFESGHYLQIIDPREGAVTLTGEVTADHWVGTRWSDVLNGGFGHDVLAGGNGSDVIHGEWGNDTLKGDGGNDRLFGDAGDDALQGGAGSDELWGGDGQDTLDGGAGNDALIGALGNDSYVISSLLDVVVENASEGTDTVSSSVISLNMAQFANIENASLTGARALNLSGSATNNVLTGNSAANLLQGQVGNDTLLGAAGNDTLDGGLGVDALTGGAGADVFRFLSVADSVGATAAARDVIADFQLGVDKIDLAVIDARTTLAGDQAFTYIGAAAFSGTTGAQLRYTGGVLSADVNGDRVADFQIQLTGSPALSAADLIL